ncbi:hypothetical protein AB0H28_27330 [Micromonospora sp. NPDC050980]|uniref:hypothetical protein n=1 Tax=Micromonospora sp. NPDC050980 TaxID=3155161 RepID=UPI0033EB1BF7
MSNLLWNFLNDGGSEAARGAVLRSLLGNAPPAPEDQRLFCWRGPTPGVDLIFADQHDVLQACVELKRLHSPAQYSAVRHAQAADLFRSVTGEADAVSATIHTVAAGLRQDRHPASNDTCGADVWHTQRRRNKDGEHQWWCAIPQIDLYRGYCLLPRDKHTAVQPQDPRDVAWILISDDQRPVADRYPSAKSAACWTPRSWTEVLASLATAATRLGDPHLEALRSSINELR